MPASIFGPRAGHAPATRHIGADLPAVPFSSAPQRADVNLRSSLLGGGLDSKAAGNAAAVHAPACARSVTGVVYRLVNGRPAAASGSRFGRECKKLAATLTTDEAKLIENGIFRGSEATEAIEHLLEGGHGNHPEAEEFESSASELSEDDDFSDVDDFASSDDEAAEASELAEMSGADNLSEAGEPAEGMAWESGEHSHAHEAPEAPEFTDIFGLALGPARWVSAVFRAGLAGKDTIEALAAYRQRKAEVCALEREMIAKLGACGLPAHVCEEIEQALKEARHPKNFARRRALIGDVAARISRLALNATARSHAGVTLAEQLAGGLAHRAEEYRRMANAEFVAAVKFGSRCAEMLGSLVAVGGAPVHMAKNAAGIAGAEAAKHAIETVLGGLTIAESGLSIAAGGMDFWADFERLRMNEENLRVVQKSESILKPDTKETLGQKFRQQGRYIKRQMAGTGVNMAGDAIKVGGGAALATAAGAAVGAPMLAAGAGLGLAGDLFRGLAVRKEAVSQGSEASEMAKRKLKRRHVAHLVDRLGLPAAIRATEAEMDRAQVTVAQAKLFRVIDKVLKKEGRTGRPRSPHQRYRSVVKALDDLKRGRKTTLVGRDVDRMRDILAELVASRPGAGGPDVSAFEGRAGEIRSRFYALLLEGERAHALAALEFVRQQAGDTFGRRIYRELKMKLLPRGLRQNPERCLVKRVAKQMKADGKYELWQIQKDFPPLLSAEISRRSRLPVWKVLRVQRTDARPGPDVRAPVSRSDQERTGKKPVVTVDADLVTRIDIDL